MSDGYPFSGDARLRWIDLPGDGTPAVFVHGLGCHGAASWAASAQRLGRPARIIDLPGHGRSDAPEYFGYTLPELADAVAGGIRDLGEPADIVGHSLGGSVAVALAHRHPELVRRSVLVEPAIDIYPATPGDIASTPEDTLASGGWRELLAREDPWRRADVKLTDPIALVRCARALGDEHASRLHEQLASMPVPTTLVRGELRDYAALGEITASGVRDVRIAGAQHFVMNDQPEAFAEVLRAALS
ncbi:alpha/beta hydrolase [Microbacterium sorbitolivorans]|uniref:Alpha/beta fold hydrolase n=1 Tax=Microbacterium sorbitolivorans TaxID=1867410 RepID=A0A367Y301_9MICO|nr:alpha/beta hydrolase [Microbacterium sorbitolivorans]RCK60208.1 alpha/beta fold hydrolase [Microbacterium sorbitolivorans]GGF48791.1 alpha/beta hydrolase [Microbacterium sorbitolivorans]